MSATASRRWTPGRSNTPTPWASSCPTADRPNEGVFALQDDDEQWMALRYDLTAPLARFAAQNWETLPKPFRRYAFGPVWRNEKPGPGRFREFIQCDADTVGSARPEADAEIIAMAAEGLEAAGLPRGQAVLKINNRKLLNGLLQAAGVETAGQKLAVLRAVDKLDRLGPDGVRLLLGEGRLDESGAFTKGAGLGAKAAESVLAFTGGRPRRPRRRPWPTSPMSSAARPRATRGWRNWPRIDAALTSMGVGGDRAAFDPSIVRGLEYYTGAVFEAELLLDDRRRQGPADALRLGRRRRALRRPGGPLHRPARPGHRLLVRRLAPGGGPGARPAADPAATPAGRWWSSPSARTRWPTTSPSPANCARAGIAGRGLSRLVRHAAADEIRRPPAGARPRSSSATTSWPPAR